MGAKVGLDQNSFEYVANPITFASEEVSKTALKATGTLGVLNSWGIIALTFTHTNGYRADAPIKYYIPINNTGIQIEKNLNPSAPIRQKSEKLRFEYLSSGYSISYVRINPNINVEFNQRLFSFEFPVYFLTSDEDKTNFNGGIYAGYISNVDFEFDFDKNNLGFGVFIGASFTNLFQ